MQKTAPYRDNIKEALGLYRKAICLDARKADGFFIPICGRDQGFSPVGLQKTPLPGKSPFSVCTTACRPVSDSAPEAAGQFVHCGVQNLVHLEGVLRNNTAAEQVFTVQPFQYDTSSRRQTLARPVWTPMELCSGIRETISNMVKTPSSIINQLYAESLRRCNAQVSPNV